MTNDAREIQGRPCAWRECPAQAQAVGSEDEGTAPLVNFRCAAGHDFWWRVKAHDEVQRDATGSNA